MRLTPLDIYQKEFKKVLRGVDPDEVEDFLEKVADDYEQLIHENAALKGQVESLGTRLAAEDKREGTDEVSDVSGDIPVVAREEEEARGIRENAFREEFSSNLNKLLEETEKKAKIILGKAKEEELALRKEISRLQGQRERFLLEYRELLEKHLKELIERDKDQGSLLET